MQSLRRKRERDTLGFGEAEDREQNPLPFGEFRQPVRRSHQELHEDIQAVRAKVVEIDLQVILARVRMRAEDLFDALDEWGMTDKMCDATPQRLR